MQILHFVVKSMYFVDEIRLGLLGVSLQIVTHIINHSVKLQN